MKYRIIIHQRIKYNDNLMGYFDDLAEAQKFIETVLKHFEKTDVSIEVITPGEEEDE